MSNKRADWTLGLLMAGAILLILAVFLSEVLR